MPLCLPNYSETILPCREVRRTSFVLLLKKNVCFFEVCERVRTPCESYYTRYGFIWPDALKCEQYPSSNENAICMDPRKNEGPANSLPKVSSSRPSQPVLHNQYHHHHVVNVIHH
jgi:hypothetical protein